MDSKIDKIKNNNKEYLSLLKELELIIEDVDDSSVEDLEKINEELSLIDDTFDNFKKFVTSMFSKVTKMFPDKEVDYEALFVALVEDSNVAQIKETFGSLVREKDYRGYLYLGRFLLFGSKGFFGSRQYINKKEALKYLKKAYLLNKENPDVLYYYAIALLSSDPNSMFAIKLLDNNLKLNAHAKSGYELLSFYRNKEFFEKNIDKKLKYSGIINNIKLLLG